MQINPVSSSRMAALTQSPNSQAKNVQTHHALIMHQLPMNSIERICPEAKIIPDKNLEGKSLIERNQHAMYVRPTR